MRIFIKLFLTLSFALLSVDSAYASLNKDDVQKALAGKYSLQIDEYEVQFLIRSSGEVQILNTENEMNGASFSLVNSVNPAGPDGLTVAHLTLMTASDEDARDYHLLLTVEQSHRGSNNIVLIHAFSTFNDGPNDYSSVEPVSQISLKKYDKERKDYIVIKN